MKRAVLVEYDQASPSIRAIYDEIMEATGKPDVPNIMKALGNNENALRAVWTMFRNTVIEGEIPNLLKELILFRISIHAGNEYCRSLHAHAACTLDPTLTYRDLRAMAEGESLKGLPASFQAAIDLVSRMALDPHSVEDKQFAYEEQLRDEGFSEAEIDELVAQAYFGVMMNTLTAAYDVPWEGPPMGDDT
jgi:alkylhydroperoxidase family enzyme